MASLFNLPKGAAMTIDAADAGLVTAASLTVTRAVSRQTEWNATTCLTEESAGVVLGLSGELTVSAKDHASYALLKLAVLGDGSGPINIGAKTITEHAITIVANNAMDCGETWTYAFPRCQLADSQEHIFAAADDATDPTMLDLTFRVLLPADGTALGTITHTPAA